jgi:uncharacterized protein YbbK (DUF523 family)
MKLVSSCLVGINCNYKGENKLNQKLLEEYKHGELFAVCPEILGGQSIPRPPAEIKNGSGLDVLYRKARVVNPDDNDVTEEFICGAYGVILIARCVNAKEAIFKARSPSCGCDKIYDGTFSKTLVDGDGVTTALLKVCGMKVVTEEDI